MGIRIGINEYYYKHNTPKSGNSFCNIAYENLCHLVELNWHKRIAGAGEGDCLDRKVLIPIDADASSPFSNSFFCGARAKLVEGMPVQAKVEARQAGEEPSISLYVRREDARKFNALYNPVPKDIKVVVYSRAALSENGDRPTTTCDWEIVTLLCSPSEMQEPMPPLTMARNFLEKNGGTKSVYTAAEFAEAIWHHGTQKDLKVRDD